ncbi:epimerase, partial [Erwinia amylovora]|nr:epimerase [Erwinia amylovora]
LIGRPLTARLLHLGLQLSVVTRDVAAALGKLGEQVKLWSGIDQQQDLNVIDAVINLAGEPIAAKRWIDDRKRLLCASGWELSERLVTLIKDISRPPALLISGSATGFYGNSGVQILTED